jgi:hypothetical protein
MRVVALHDADGNIESLLASPEGSPSMGTEVKPGQRMTEIDVPELTSDLDGSSLLDRLDEMISSHRVEAGPSQARLVQKTG